MNRIGIGWPGFALLWNQGDVRGLACAGLFALVLNYAILVGGWFPWSLAACTWLAGTMLSARWRRAAEPRSASAEEAARREELLTGAQTEYLKGHWFEAEALLEELTALDRFDLPAHLLLATLWRRTGRFEAAEKRLQLIGGLPGASRWLLEREQESRALARRKEEAAEAEAESVAAEQRRQEAA